MPVNLERFNLQSYSTMEVAGAQLLVSLGELAYISPSKVEVTVGAIGRKNIRRVLTPGDFIAYDAGALGTYEVRLLGFHASEAQFHVAKIA